jgi:cell wall-associated NlpC family hydrolase
MSIRHKAGTIAGSMAVLSLAFTGLSGVANAKTQSFNQKVAGDAVTFVHKVPYVYGGSSPKTGFDCSGLTSYVYGHYGKSIPRTAEAQFQRFHRISESKAWGGDLVFFHETSSPTSYVYHVAVYEGNGRIVSASTPSEGIVREKIYSSHVTFGTITH